ncbi:MAG: tRNA 2-thiouridine(34) synthase MnmA [Actinomycetales bacterium]|nr:tRNA 2-thiouridine(34) synthase MnmA [Actinomycetales bacterium]
MRVLAAMSGGVDSSVAAARMVHAGHEVTGVHLALAKSARASGRSRGCCTLDDARDARRVADRLGIPFYVWDMADDFADEVIADFIAEYQQGRTPNPCLRCNERIKFSAVLERALAIGFDAVATGHYARIIAGPDGPQLHRAVDADKDQSYVLGVLTPHQLAHAIFPLGADRKQDVRAEAERLGLLVAGKPDSHDICFIPDGDTAGFIARSIGEQPGEIVDAGSGEVLGSHAGAFGFTIGQRRGLGLGRPAPDGAPRYVVDVDISARRVVVGTPDLLDVHRIEATHATWCGEPLGEEPCGVLAQVRAHGVPVPATARVEGGTRVIVDLDTAIRGLAPGQALVLYRGTRVLGAATVTATDRVGAR